MTKLSWNKPGERFFEAGVDRGALYVDGAPGVSWNGLTSVSEGASGGEVNAYYIDGIKYHQEAAPSETALTIEAYTYPDEFERCLGLLYSDTGLGFTNQTKQEFGMSYRTLIGNDVSERNYGYKIHLIYNALASASDKSYATISEDLDPLTFSWSVTTRPELFTSAGPTAHLIVDTTKVAPNLVSDLENALYGTSTTAPSLPPSSEVISILYGNHYRIVENYDTGLSVLVNYREFDLMGPSSEGLYKATPHTRLTKLPTDGLNRLE